MSALELLNAYLKRLEARFRLAALVRGLAITATSALAATVVIVLAANWFAFSERSLTAGRVALFLCLAFALGFGLALPLTRLNRRKTARDTESRAPEFEQRLLTLAEKQAAGEPEAFLELLAQDTLQVAAAVEPERVVKRPLVIGFSSAALAAVGALLWLIFGTTGFMGYGARLLWAGPPRGVEQPAFYDIRVTPGDRTIRRGGSQTITAELIGFEAAAVRLFARYRDSAKWEEAPMVQREGSSAYEFLFAGLPATVEYYAAAGRIRSKTYTLTVVDVPNVKRLRVQYRYPQWTGLPAETEDPASGDLRAVEGTEVEIAVETDRPLTNGQILLDDGTRIDLKSSNGNWQTARLRVERDGVYHIAAIDRGEAVRLTDDFFIDVQKDNPPLVQIRRPGRDARVLPIEEVPIEVEAADDFGLREFNLHYSVNGGPEKVVSMLKGSGARESDGEVLLALEEYKLVPGDVVAFYASARDARSTTRSDMFFIEAQPYEREYTQSQQMGGGMEGMEGGGQQQRPGQISQRQKEILAATWNQLRDKSSDKKAVAENAQFLYGMQSKLKEQAQSMATRMGRRELSEQNEEFQGFAKDMEEAAKAMGEAAGHLKDARWQQAVAPEQKALQHLLRAEATFRQIQVAFSNRGGQRGGGQGGGNQARDLENLFDLELDTEKNQYETGQQASTGSQRDREIDEALQRLEQLARRQQELAAQARQPQQTLQQRWQQELLRREAEQLQRQMEQLSRSGGQPGRGQGQGDARLRQALDRLAQATEDMRRASSAQSGGQPQSQADSRRAAERLREAQDLLRGMRTQQAGQQVSDLARRADELASAQQDYQQRLRQLFREQTLPDGRISPEGVTREQVQRSQQMAAERERMQQELSRLARDMQQASRELAGSQRGASSKIRSALGNLQQDEIEERMRYNAELLRRGYGPYVIPREIPVTQGLNALRDQLREAQAAVSGDPNRGGQENTQQVLAQLERLRNQLRGLTGEGRQQQGQRGAGNNQNAQRGNNPLGQGGAGQQQAGQRGQNQQPGQGRGQGQGQGGGQSGQRGDGSQTQQAGGQRGGNPQGDRTAEGPLFRDGEWQFGRQAGGDGWRRAAINRGDYEPGPFSSNPRILDPAEAERIYRESMRTLTELRQSLGANPEASEEIQQLIREMSRLDLSRLAENPVVLDRIKSVILPNLEQLELRLRREAEDKEGGQIRNAGGETIPPGYTDAVAEYFRRLGQAK